MAQTVKNLPAVQETQVRSLGREGPLEKVPHSCLLAPCFVLPSSSRCSPLFTTPVLFLCSSFIIPSFWYLAYSSMRNELFPDLYRLYSTSFVAICITMHTPVLDTNRLEKCINSTNWAGQLKKCEDKTLLDEIGRMLSFLLSREMENVWGGVSTHF